MKHLPGSPLERAPRRDHGQTDNVTSSLCADPARPGRADGADPADAGVPPDAGGAGRSGHGRAGRPAVGAAARRSAAHAAGYDQPLILQYVDYLGDVASGNFGTTITDNRPVSDVIIENGSATLELTFAAMMVALVVGDPLRPGRGQAAATRPSTSGIRLFGIVIYAAPVFFLGFLAQLVFAKHLGWLPSSGRASPDRAVRLLPTADPHLPVDAAHRGRLVDASRTSCST